MNYVKCLLHLGTISALIMNAPSYATTTSTLDRTSDAISATDLMTHIRYLASDDLKGRGAGTVECHKAGNYIAETFHAYGLKPAGDNNSYFQPFLFTSGMVMGKRNFMSIPSGERRRKLTVEKDFQPLPFAKNGRLRARLVFAGYGISAPKLNYDDYHNIDVKGKIVLVLRFSPDGDNPHSKFNDHASLRRKATVARNKGARGILFVLGPLTRKDDVFPNLRPMNSSTRAGILAAGMARGPATELMARAGKGLKDIQHLINEARKPHSFVIPKTRVDWDSDLTARKATARNVLGFLPASNPHKRQEIIVVGAHYDHLGLGGHGSRSPEKLGEIHNGADDNASGTAGILELAQYFTKHQGLLGRGLLFIAFSAEERGLIGSRYFVKNPTMPLNSIVAMINLDMIGRLRDNTLNLIGVRSSTAFRPIVRSLKSNFKLGLNEETYAFGSSDQRAFDEVNIPALHFFTGVHPEYHTPEDDSDKINAAGTERIVRLAAALLEPLCKLKRRPAFTRTAKEAQSVPRLRVRIGSIPDYGNSAQGVLLAGVSDPSPAAKAGLQRGDLIIEVSGKKITNVYDYMYALADLYSKKPTQFVIVRDDKKLTLTIVPENAK